MVEGSATDVWPERFIVREKVKALAKAKGFSKWPEVANLLGMSTGSFRTYIYSKNERPPEDFIAAVARLVGMTPEEAGYGKRERKVSTQMPKLVYAQPRVHQEPLPTPLPIATTHDFATVASAARVRACIDMLAPDSWSEVERAHAVRELQFILDRINSFRH